MGGGVINFRRSIQNVICKYKNEDKRESRNPKKSHEFCEQPLNGTLVVRDSVSF